MTDISDINDGEIIDQEDYEQYMEMSKTIDNLDDTIAELNKELCDEKCETLKKLKECRTNQYKTIDEHIKCEDILRQYNNEYDININEVDEDIFNKEIEELTYNLKYNHETTKDNINNLITDYNTSVIYYNKLLTLYNKINNEKILYDEKIDNYNKIINTSDRKTYYEDENINSINNKKYLLLLIYWILLSYLTYKLLYVNKQYKSFFIVIQLIILFIIPIYGIKYIKHFILYIYKNLKLLYYKYISFK